jgi:hypothetical protein
MKEERHLKEKTAFIEKKRDLGCFPEGYLRDERITPVRA